MIKINDIELEDIDLMDADTMEVVEEIVEKARLENERSAKYTSNAEMIRDQCAYVSESFDKLFGEGTSEKLFKGKTNMRVAVCAFAELMEVISTKQEEAEKEFSKYNSNRAARRR